MHVVVLGAGVVGVTTAYYLVERGHTVTVVDQADEVASGASGGNGGQLSYSFTDAMASPALLAKLPRVISGLDPAFCMRPPIGTLPGTLGPELFEPVHTTTRPFKYPGRAADGHALIFPDGRIAIAGTIGFFIPQSRQTGAAQQAIGTASGRGQLRN